MSDHATGSAPDLTRMPDEWWRARQRQAVEQVQKTGTTVGLKAEGPTVVVTVTGAKTGIPRQVPLLRVEHEGRYLIAAAKGGASREPVWAANVRANPDVTLQDGEETGNFAAREVLDGERKLWWERAVAAQPALAGYAEATDRLIALFVLDPA